MGWFLLKCCYGIIAILTWKWLGNLLGKDQAGHLPVYNLGRSYRKEERLMVSV
ncbi:hypothetical protein Hypma_004782 [Hypsizygus marmoreus]|uniref:Uncharacterized protein n=1 Tax=Hypsizygus marmoreus TaxID=39966 RepID=A0A369J665_HYPMA|nr:hypothetical protein Hypma_004782 [Hypsizygus marmoreus]